jgi:GNAT superfamily N-acetyltransferase
MRENTYVALAEIRFKGLDPAQPFVELSLLDQRDAHIADVASAALDAFAPFQPRRARAWFDAESVSEKHVNGLWLAPDQYCLVGHLQTLKQRAEEASRLHLKRATQGCGAYERYKSLHQQYETERPEVARELYLLPENEFADLLNHGMAYDAFSDSDWAGFVAAAPAPLWGQSGIAVQEEFLATEFRGRGFGPWLQRALLERLTGPDDALLWGTIHACNQPSLRTARAVGRVPIGASCWIGPARCGEGNPC